jgi:hypothetical protein
MGVSDSGEARERLIEYLARLNHASAPLAVRGRRRLAGHQAPEAVRTLASRAGAYFVRRPRTISLW